MMKVQKQKHTQKVIFKSIGLKNFSQLHGVVGHKLWIMSIETNIQRLWIHLIWCKFIRVTPLDKTLHFQLSTVVYSGVSALQFL